MREHNDGLNTLSHVFLDFAHPFEQTENYSRQLHLDSGIATVGYDYAGIRYLRELFASYADYFRAYLPKARANADQYLKDLGREDIAPAGNVPCPIPGSPIAASPLWKGHR